jgi:hypothetical protein
MTMRVVPGEYRRRSSIIQALHYSSPDDCGRIHEMIGKDHSDSECVVAFEKGYGFEINATDGLMRVLPGEWVIKTDHGDVVKMPDNLFAEMYEPVAAVKAGDPDMRWVAAVPGKEGYVAVSIDPLDASTERDWKLAGWVISRVPATVAVVGWELYANNRPPHHRRSTI